MFRLWRQTRKCMLFVFFVVGPALTITLPVQAEETQEPECTLFKKGRLSVQLVEGVFDSPFLVNVDRRRMDYYQTNLRIGLMLDDPKEPKHFFKGNWRRYWMRPIPMWTAKGVAFSRGGNPFGVTIYSH